MSKLRAEGKLGIAQEEKFSRSVQAEETTHGEELEGKAGA